MVWSSNLPGAVIIPCACIVLLSEASSSSHFDLSTPCVSTRSWAQNKSFEARRRIPIEKCLIFAHVESPWPCQNFHPWIFLDTGLVPIHGDWPYLVAYKTRAQTNWSIQSYQWKTNPFLHIVFIGLNLQSSLPSNISLCLYSIEASSSSHVIFQHRASARAHGPKTDHLRPGDVSRSRNS